MGGKGEGDSSPLNSKLLTYKIKVRQEISRKVREMDYKDKSTLGCVVSNLVSSLRKSVKLVYSRSLGKTKNVGRKAINSRKVMKAIDFLEREGYILNSIGRPSASKDYRSVSYIDATPLFRELFSNQLLMEVCEEDYQEGIEVIELRDENKNPVMFRQTEMIREMKEVVKALNAMNEKAEVRDGEGQILTNFYCRVFNEEFSYGGRFYRADILQLKNSDHKRRLDITIDGKPVVEIDFANLHFRIAAARKGVCLFEDVPVDIYSDMLEDETNMVDRSMVKLAVNVMFNCRTREKARMAIQSEINAMKPEDKAIYTLGNAKAVMLLIEDTYLEFIHLFCRSDSYGRELQNEDSNLANSILKKMIDKGIVCLPCHDSFIVQREHEGFLLNAMGDCFREQFDIDTEIPVTLSYQDDGKLVQHKILT
jgi:hypothetical protein